MGDNSVKFYLVTTIGIGKVRMKIPVMAQRPQINFPMKVAGFTLYPTVVRVIKPHQKES